MRDKVKQKKYKTCEEFQSDFELVIQNSKTYNAPDSVYYKAAEKLHAAGLKLIQKECEFVVPDLEIDFEAGYSPEATPEPPVADRVFKINEATRKAAYKEEEKIVRRSTKKFKHCEDLEVAMAEEIYTDGTRTLGFLQLI